MLRTLVEPQQAVPTWPARRAPRKKNRLCGLDLRGFKKKCNFWLWGRKKEIRKNSSFTGFESLFGSYSWKNWTMFEDGIVPEKLRGRAVMKVTSWLKTQNASKSKGFLELPTSLPGGGEKTVHRPNPGDLSLWWLLPS